MGFVPRGRTFTTAALIPGPPREILSLLPMAPPRSRSALRGSCATNRLDGAFERSICGTNRLRVCDASKVGLIDGIDRVEGNAGEGATDPALRGVRTELES